MRRGSINQNSVLNAMLPNVNGERVAKWAERSVVRLGWTTLGKVWFRHHRNSLPIHSTFGSMFIHFHLSTSHVATTFLSIRIDSIDQNGVQTCAPAKCKRTCAVPIVLCCEERHDICFFTRTYPNVAQPNLTAQLFGNRKLYVFWEFVCLKKAFDEIYRNAL